MKNNEMFGFKGKRTSGIGARLVAADSAADAAKVLDALKGEVEAAPKRAERFVTPTPVVVMPRCSTLVELKAEASLILGEEVAGWPVSDILGALDDWKALAAAVLPSSPLVPAVRVVPDAV